MSRYVWLALAAVVAVTTAVLFWADRSAVNEATPAPRPPPVAASGDGGRAWRPHLDRAGLRRKAIE